MTEKVPVPLEQQIACVAREIRMRRRVYPSWVARSRMRQTQAEHEIAAMEAVLETLRGLLPPPAQGGLGL